MKKVIIIGGGAAGMMAALQSRLNGAQVVLIEKNSKLGMKMGISGKGRCNITNAMPIDDFINNYANNGKFLYSSFAAFSNQDLMAMLEGFGLGLKVERGDRVFPQSDRALDIVGALLHALQTAGVEIKRETSCRKIILSDGNVRGVEIESGKVMKCDAIIIATGGLSYPGTGSTGDGYALGAECGHTIINPRPALVGLETEKWVSNMAGLSLKNVTAAISLNGKKLASEFGEMLFTHTGVSGPIILTLSSVLSGILADKAGACMLHIDLKPALSDEQLENRIMRDIESAGKKQLQNFFGQLLPRTLVDVFISHCGLQAERTADSLNKKEIIHISRKLHDFTVAIKKVRPIAEAIVTAGGISVKQINPKTLQSKLVSGLFFAGEVIDIDGFTGGFNFQAAFSTGYIAGRAAAQ